MDAETEAPKEAGWWKAAFLGIIALLIVAGNILVWYFWFRAPSKKNSAAVSQVTETPTPTIDETELIRQACFLKTGLNSANATIAISKNTGQHATGTIKELEAVSGAWWIAAKADGQWVCVYTGQSQATCAEIAPYNFPKDMVPECLNEKGKVIKR